jgi:hypothetical protein
MVSLNKLTNTINDANIIEQINKEANEGELLSLVRLLFIQKSDVHANTVVLVRAQEIR